MRRGMYTMYMSTKQRQLTQLWAILTSLHKAQEKSFIARKQLRAAQNVHYVHEHQAKAADTAVGDFNKLYKLAAPVTASSVVIAACQEV